MTDAKFRKNRSLWGNCPYCMYERPIINGVMKEHRRYYPEVGQYGTMLHCLGSGEPPLTTSFVSLNRK